MVSYKSLVSRLSSLVFIIASAAYAEAPRIVPAILDSVPHEKTHFTQGLFFDGSDLIETTGMYGKSGLYRRTLDGKILDSARLAERYFGEGSIAVGDDIFYLTWKSKKAFIYSRKPFKPKGEFRIPTEGWGLTYWKDALLMSNGSEELLQIALGAFNVSGVIRADGFDCRYRTAQWQGAEVSRFECERRTDRSQFPRCRCAERHSLRRQEPVGDGQELAANLQAAITVKPRHNTKSPGFDRDYFFDAYGVLYTS